MNLPAYFPEPQTNPSWVDAPDEPEPPDLKWGEVLVHAIDPESDADVSVMAVRAEFDGVDWPRCAADCTNDAHRIFYVYRTDDNDNPYSTSFPACSYHTLDIVFCLAVANDEGLARAMALGESPLSVAARWYIQRWVDELGPDTRFESGEG